MTHKTYITFGQGHHHTIGEQIFDKDCVAVIESEGPKQGREKAFEMFDKYFCFEYPQAYWNESKLRYFPRGYIEVKA